MLGHKASLKAVVASARAAGARSLRTTRFFQVSLRPPPRRSPRDYNAKIGT
jgi:hypothetical protein